MIKITPEARIEFDRFLAENATLPVSTKTEIAARVKLRESEQQAAERLGIVHKIGEPISGVILTPEETRENFVAQMINPFLFTSGRGLSGEPLSTRQTWIDSEAEEELQKAPTVSIEGREVKIPVFHLSFLDEYFENELAEPSHIVTKQIVESNNGVMDLVAMRRWIEEEKKESSHRNVVFSKK